MNLRKLISTTSYKKFFNAFFHIRYANSTYSSEEVTKIDIFYYKFYNSLSSIESEVCPSHTVIKLRWDTEVDFSDQYVSVTLYDKSENSSYSIESFSWGELLDLEIDSPSDLTNELILAHIFNKITTWDSTDNPYIK